MKVSTIVLALYSVMLCVHAASLEQQQKVNETDQDSHVGIVDFKQYKLNSPTVKIPEESDRGCPDGPSTSAGASLMERAVCPWYVKTTHDENRRPEVIEEAVCRCKGCLTGGTCQPSYADIPVLRKNSHGTFEFEKLMIAVACNCIIDQL